MCINCFCYNTDTYLQYNVQIEKQVEKYMWDLHHKLVLFQQSRIFSLIPENEIKVDILGWTPSLLTSVMVSCFYVFIPNMKTRTGINPLDISTSAKVSGFSSGGVTSTSSPRSTIIGFVPRNSFYASTFPNCGILSSTTSDDSSVGVDSWGTSTIA